MKGALTGGVKGAVDRMSYKGSIDRMNSEGSTGRMTSAGSTTSHPAGTSPYVGAGGI